MGGEGGIADMGDVMPEDATVSTDAGSDDAGLPGDLGLALTQA